MTVQNVERNIVSLMPPSGKCAHYSKCHKKERLKPIYYADIYKFI